MGSGRDGLPGLEDAPISKDSGNDEDRMTPQQYVQDKAASSGSSFYYAFLFLPEQRRQAITAFYAFCREIDDVVDETSDPSIARARAIHREGLRLLR